MKKADFPYSGFVAVCTVLMKIGVISMVAMLWLPTASMAKDARAYSAVSPGIERLKSEMSYPIANTGQQDTLDKVYIAVSYAGNATVHSELCHGSGSPCIQVGRQGRQSDAFKGLAASPGFILTHTVQQWGTSPRPLFIQSDLSLWTQ